MEVLFIFQFGFLLLLFLLWWSWLGFPKLLYKSSKSKHPFLVSDLRGNAFSFSTLSTILPIGLWYIALYYVELEEKKNRMGKTRDLFKKIRDTKGTFHAKMGWIKDRNCMDLIEAEDIKKRWQEYKKLYKKKKNSRSR